MLRPLYTLAIVLLLLISNVRAWGQEEPGELEAEYQFGEWIKIHLEPKDGGVLKGVQFFLQNQGESDTWSSPLLSNEGPDKPFEYKFDLSELNLRAFSTLLYWYEIPLNSGDVFASSKQFLYYEDNRFNWKQREQKPFTVSWHTGDNAFAQDVLDSAQMGLEKIQTILPVPEAAPVRIYVYDNPLDLRDTFQTSGQTWIGAHTDPELGVMVVSLPPGPEQRLEMERQISHELMHIMLYQKLGPSYINLPTWLNEGLASAAELYPNPDYLILLESAREKDNLFPISSLCREFPREAAGAYLAYAESASFTRFIQLQYGSILLDQIARQYANGLDCERGIEVALGVSLNQAEREWQQETLGNDPWVTALQNLAPWLVLLAAILIVPVALMMATLRRPPTRREPVKKAQR